jgi:hypothetical protein
VPGTETGSFEINVNLEVVGQNRSAIFKRRKEFGTDWGRKREG